MSAADPRSTIQAPKGWSKDDRKLGIQGYWGKDEEGQFVAKRHGLEEAKPILVREGGDVLYLFQAGENYYFLDPIQGEVTQIVEPKTLAEIVTTMSEPGGSLARKDVKQTVSL
ncbi:hypothetical protein BDW42DRAFT_157684 [Aspergillus taichungensis]|uniref:Uncharacterized protein n=1 Tax=Aspergillus taichungensis TaxID=482145 RepID=A0A2J5HK58_9EURO|nr:hypothetical protein BDW42DRAFT_157684 [Aspergillus taichungensis]